MKHLRIYEAFKGFNRIEILCRKYKIRNYKVNENGSVDVHDDVYLYKKNIGKILLKFNKVYGDFDCDHNGLITLENCPKWISGHFICMNNKLTTLLNGPKIVKGEYWCGNNNIKDFYGFPDSVGGNVSFINNPVIELLNLIPYRESARFIHSLNENKVIENGDTLNKEMLERFLHNIGINRLKTTHFKNYKLI